MKFLALSGSDTQGPEALSTHGLRARRTATLAGRTEIWTDSACVLSVARSPFLSIFSLSELRGDAISIQMDTKALYRLPKFK